MVLSKLVNTILGLTFKV